MSGPVGATEGAGTTTRVLLEAAYEFDSAFAQEPQPSAAV